MVFTNPWISIWTQPKATIASIVSVNPKRGIWVLAWIYGFLSLLNVFQSISMGNGTSLAAILIISAILAPLIGIIVFGIWSWVLFWTGKLLRGQGDFSSIRAAYAWSCVPLSVSMILWVFLIFYFGLPLFQNFPNNYSPLSSGQIVLFYTVLVTKVVIAIWSLVIYIHALATVQQFSIGRSILNIIISWIVISVVFWLFWWSINSLNLAGSITLNVFFRLW